jgi:ppGpp synthetase/RelA/SpoT-type nucleotidyltranferase
MEQDWIVAVCEDKFPRTDVKDRRESPSHGYRAVHVIVTILGKLIEIQIRTELQDLWAQISEKSADLFGQEVKYGGGPEFWRKVLVRFSDQVAVFEAVEGDPAQNLVAPDEMNRLRTKIKESLNWAIATLDEAQKGDQH